MALSRRAAARMHPQDDTCAVAESYNAKLKRGGSRDSASVASLSQTDAGVWKGLKKIWDKWARLQDSDPLPSFTSLMEDSEKRARASKVAELTNGPRQKYTVEDKGTRLSTVVDLTVSCTCVALYAMY